MHVQCTIDQEFKIHVLSCKNIHGVKIFQAVLFTIAKDEKFEHGNI